jgi:hypothetical protein
MKFTNKNFHGGDVQGYGISELPKGSTKVTGVADRIIARGETSGHAHILTGDVDIFKDEKTGRLFAVVGKDGAFHQHYKEAMIKEDTYTVNKNISNCDHTKECFIEEGNYALGLDRQYDPNAEVWIQNKD